MSSDVRWLTSGWSNWAAVDRAYAAMKKRMAASSAGESEGARRGVEVRLRCPRWGKYGYGWYFPKE